MSQIFLSHSSIDKPIVRMLASDIKASGAKIWFDEIELKVGDSLILKISDAIREATYVVAFLSTDSIKSNWVKKELAVASTIGINENRVFVLPILIGSIKTADIPAFLLDYIYIDFRRPAEYDIAFLNLLRRLKPSAIPEKILNVDSFRADILVEIAARDNSMCEWVIDYLVETLPLRRDETERYWSYIALGKINGEKAEKAIQDGLTIEKPNGFARLGAEEGLELLNIIKKSCSKE